MPDQPGVYLALCIEPNLIANNIEDLSDTQSTSSMASLTQNMPLASLKKHIFSADHFLDIEKLPSKT